VQQEIGHDRAASLAARARQLRRTAGISFAAMAAEASVAKSTLHRWETAGPGRSARARHWLAVLAVLDATPGPHTVVAPTHRAPVRCPRRRAAARRQDRVTPPCTSSRPRARS